MFTCKDKQCMVKGSERVSWMKRYEETFLTLLTIYIIVLLHIYFNMLNFTQVCHSITSEVHTRVGEQATKTEILSLHSNWLTTDSSLYYCNTHTQ